MLPLHSACLPILAYAGAGILRRCLAGSGGVLAFGVPAAICAVERFRPAGDRRQDRRSTTLRASKNKGLPKRLCRIPELATRAEYVQKHVHQSLHLFIYDLSDLELIILVQNALKNNSREEPSKLINRIKGSEAFGTRCFSMPRGQFIAQKIPKKKLRKRLSYVSDQELLKLRTVANPDACLALLSASRTSYIEKCIPSNMRDQLSDLSDGALFVLGSSTIGRPDSRALQTIAKADKFLPVSRSSWLSDIRKDPIVQRKLTELGKLTDHQVSSLGRRAKHIGKYLSVLALLEKDATSKPAAEEDGDEAEPDIQDGSSLAGIEDALGAEGDQAKEEDEEDEEENMEQQRGGLGISSRFECSCSFELSRCRSFGCMDAYQLGRDARYLCRIRIKRV